MEALNFTSIKKEVTVNASQETAFKVFTEKINLWWPRALHIGKCPMTEMVLEPKQDGSWFTNHEDGSKEIVGYVLKYQPYGLFVLAWQINGDYLYDPDLVTEVEVHFIHQGPGKTKVKFEHKDMQLLGGVKTVGSMDEGWGMILELYKNLTEHES